MSAMRIYVACLASYNAGILHGLWIDASSDVDAMQADISAMLRASPCPNVTYVDVTCRETATSEGAVIAPGVRGCGETFRVQVIVGDARDFPSDCPRCGAHSIMERSAPYSSAEEYAVHDYDGVPSTFGEYPGLDKIAAFVELVEEFDHIDAAARAALAAADAIAEECAAHALAVARAALNKETEG